MSLILFLYNNNQMMPQIGKLRPLISQKRIFILIFLILIILHSILMFSLRIYPFVNLPNHLSVATIYKHYGEETNQFNKFFSLDLPFKPNIFHIIFCSLKIFPSVEFGNKIFYFLFVILFPLSILLTITKVKGNKWVSL